MAMKKLKAEASLQAEEESDEINTCSIVVPVDVDGKEEEWLINFKRTRHTAIDGDRAFWWCGNLPWRTMRDPLSGRTYVYQAMH